MAPSSTAPSNAIVATKPLRPRRTEFTLSGHRLLTLDLSDGDLLHSESGSIWVTLEGHLRDIVLVAGARYRVPGPSRLRLSGFGAARLTVVKGAPA